MQPFGKTDSFERSIICPLDHVIVYDCLKHFFRDGFPICDLDHLYRSVVGGVAEKQNVEIRVLRIAVDAGFPDVSR